MPYTSSKKGGLKARFDDRYRVDPETGCHNWLGFCDPRGYGRIYGNGRKQLAHRVGWELARGPIPKGKFLCHSCDNPGCVNPEHMFVGDHAANMRDMTSKARHKHGERSNWAKLTTEDVEQIRWYHAKGCSQKTLAREYNVDPSQISRIVNRKRWAYA